MTEKARFVRDMVVRLAPEPERVEAAVGRAEALWDGLERLGYGEARPGPERPAAAEPPPARERPAMGWDGPPQARPAVAGTFHPAHTLVKAKPAPGPAELRQAAWRDLKYWDRLAAEHPGKEDIALCLAKARDKYAELTPGETA